MLSLHFHIVAHLPIAEGVGSGTRGQKLMMEGCCLLSYSGLLDLLVYSTQNYQPTVGTTYNELGPPHQSLIK